MSLFLSLPYAADELLQSLLQMNVPHLHSESFSLPPDGPRGRGQM